MAPRTADYVKNPRRSPRAQASCLASITAAAGRFEGTTEDLNGYGCRLVSPRLVRKGEPIQLVLSHPLMTSKLRTNGRVVWTTNASPWRLGVSFDEASRADSERWFSQLLTAGEFSRSTKVPDRIPLATVVYLGSPPRYVFDVTSEELAVLQTIGAGMTIFDLLAAFPEQRSMVERALFSLLAQRLATLSRGISVHPNAWKHVFPTRPSRLPAWPHRDRTPAVVPAATRVPPGRLRTSPSAARASTAPSAGDAAWSPLFLAMIPPEHW